ncbi:MAG: hypothetical protein JWM99_5014 [Verrucomicrobiales bacterium]|nr:hypothetical protein [Verrucomicrobiales bacterium]
MIRRATSFFRLLNVLLILCAIQSGTRAKVLDNFNDNTKTDWTDFTFVPGLGLPVEESGQFKFDLPPAGQALFVASTKTSQTFMVEDGKTVEFRVDLISGNGKDSFAILAFIPKSSTASSLGGYGFAKSTTDILVTKGIGKYFYNQNPPDPLKNENVTMVLSLTGQGSNVVINARLLDKDDGNKVIFEKTFIDTPAAEVLDDGADSPPAPYMGPGNFVLYCYEDFDSKAPQDSYQVLFDNAESYVVENTVLDDFNDNTKTDWTDFTFVPGLGLPVEAGGQFTFDLPAAGQALFVASTKTSKNYSIVEGEKLELSIDLVDGNGKDSFAILAFIPTASSASSLAGYGLAKSTTDILITKGIGKYFYNQNPPVPIQNTNVILKLTLIGKDGNVIINGQVIDKDSNAILFDKTFVDTPAADVMDDGADSPAAPFLGAGNFVLYCYEDFDSKAPQDSYKVIFDNARVAAPPVVANTAPIISDVSPATSASFVPAGNSITFKVTDDQNLLNDKISVMLNGVTYTTNNGLVLAGAGNIRTGTLGGLATNNTYSAVINVADSDNASTTVATYFDTFLGSNLVIEVEDYNSGSGQFIDNPVPVAENSGPLPNGYANQAGTSDIDYSDTRTDLNDVPYRPDDHVRMQHSLDVPRAKFSAAGGAAASVFDYDVGDVVAGEWLNYTRTFGAGNYEVYLREALVNGAQVKADLEQVTSDPTAPDQTVTKLGSFNATTSGFQFRNVPLTDAVGQRKVVVRLNGSSTLRLHQISSEPGDGNIYQNYLMFVPVADAGLQRANVESALPLAGSTVTTVGPSVQAVIRNHDTTVKTNSIVLTLNGTPVPVLITNDTQGATVTYTLPETFPTGVPVAVRLVFQDNLNVSQTNDWTFTLGYKTLDAVNRANGTGSEPGFKVRMVQAPAGSALENSLARAEQQLAPNSSIPVFVSTNFITDVLNFADRPDSNAGSFPGDMLVPGLDPDTNGGDDFAVEMSAYLQLSAGAHRFGVISDDGYKVTAGISLTDTTSAFLAAHNGGPANETFEFVTPQAGLYPFRIVWYERGGSGYFELFSEDRTTGDRALINDITSANPVKAFRSIIGQTATVETLTSATVAGTFTLETAAVLDASAHTVTLPADGPMKFIRLRLTGASSGGIQIQNIKGIAGGKVVLTFVLTN